MAITKMTSVVIQGWINFTAPSQAFISETRVNIWAPSIILAGSEHAGVRPATASDMSWGASDTLSDFSGVMAGASAESFCSSQS